MEFKFGQLDEVGGTRRLRECKRNLKDANYDIDEEKFRFKSTVMGKIQRSQMFKIGEIGNCKKDFWGLGDEIEYLWDF